MTHLRSGAPILGLTSTLKPLADLGVLLQIRALLLARILFHCLENIFDMFKKLDGRTLYYWMCAKAIGGRLRTDRESH